MNQNSTDNDLQKAIDDITNTTNSDPVFADPVAAPSSIPEGDTGELAESVGPFPAPQPMPMPPVAPPEPPVEQPAIADFSIPPIQQPVPEEPQRPAAPVVSETTTVATETVIPTGLSIREIKTAALRDLAPLVGKMDLPASQKFNIYRDMFENLRDYTVIEQAYQSAKDIMNEHERAEALLYLVQAIDNM